MPKTKFQSVVFTAIMAFLCFPAAFCLQVFFVGPLVRKIFRTIFAA